jgi:hypothetical protein
VVGVCVSYALEGSVGDWVSCNEASTGGIVLTTTNTTGA